MQFVFYIADLLRTELIIKDDHTDLTVVLFLFVDILLDFLEFTLSHIADSTRSAHTLRKALHGDSTGCVGEKFQFVKIFFGLCLILLGRDKSHQNSSLGLYLRNNKFLHIII